MQQTNLLGTYAQQVARTSMFALQAQMPHDPVFCGAIAVADVMLAGFTEAANAFDLVMAESVGNGTDEELPDFS